MAAISGKEEKGTWLLLKHFPKWLTAADKESLLAHFGATQVVVMAPEGKMKNCVFALFSSASDSSQALSKLHQLEIFGSRLVVEYAHSAHHKLALETERKDKLACNKSSKLLTRQDPDKQEAKVESVKERAETHSSDHVRGVRYLYPPATPTTLTNITSTLVCVPEFYQQVLHLMNLMNLPPPFGPLTPVPPPIPVPPPAESEGGEEGEREDSSELESDEEERERRKKRARSPVLPEAVKRHKMSYQQVKTLQTSLKKGTTSVEEPTPPLASRLKIELKVPSELTTHSEEAEPLPTTINYIEPVSTKQSLPSPSSTVCAPVGLEGSPPPPPPSEEEGGGAFITLRELKRNRLSSAEMRESHVYKNYSAGETSTRLYIKNLAKQVEEKDLRYLFGRYVNWDDETEKNIFDVRLMQSGRMKGQAFVGLPSETVASRALQETNGYVLHGKPMVVHFARSSKPKDQQT